LPGAAGDSLHGGAGGAAGTASALFLRGDCHLHCATFLPKVTHPAKWQAAANAGDAAKPGAADYEDALTVTNGPLPPSASSLRFLPALPPSASTLCRRPLTLPSQVMNGARRFLLDFQRKGVPVTLLSMQSVTLPASLVSASAVINEGPKVLYKVRARDTSER
jgi:hypothetical protein